ncbi:hypothetical protein ACM43_33155 [Bradyrhizobium sp. CCBAU 45321]|nr:hypothetical protein [Bradyrhizobium sp. CCBAU 45321]
MFKVIAMPRVPPRTLAAVLTLAGIVALVMCMLGTAFEWPFLTGAPANQKAPNNVADAGCGDGLKAALDPGSIANAKSAADDANGKFRIVDVLPRTIRLGGRLCVVVAGVASEAGEKKLKKDVEDNETKVKDLQTQLDTPLDAKTKTETEKKLDVANVALSVAKAAQNQPPPVVDVTLFLNGRRTPMSLKVPAIPAPQTLVFEFGQTPDAASDDAKFWRGLLANKTNSGSMPLKIGVSRSQSSTPEAEARSSIELRVYWPYIVGLGALSMALLLTGFAIFAAKSSVLRDHSLTNIDLAEQNARTARDAAAADPTNADLQKAKTKAEDELKECMASPTRDDPAGTFSLGRTQMALWLWLSTAGFIFLWLTLGIYRNVITEAILVLLGINSVTGIAAVILDRDDLKNPIRVKSKRFWSDLLSDEDGPKLHRIQMIGWTAILAVIFIWNVVANFIFVEFDTNLLLLMGIVNSTYLGFKTQEKAAKK